MLGEITVNSWMRVGSMSRVHVSGLLITSNPIKLQTIKLPLSTDGSQAAVTFFLSTRLSQLDRSTHLPL